MRSLYWVRTDLRLTDNQTLEQFCQDSDEGMFLWVQSPSYLRASKLRQAFTDSCVASFSGALLKHKQKLQLGTEPIEVELARHIQKHRLDRVYFTREFACEEKTAEEKVRKLCQENGVEVVAMDQSTLVREEDLPFGLAKLPLVFTEFKKKVEANFQVRPLVPAPEQYPRSLVTIPESGLPAEWNSDAPLAGESAAQARLRHYLWATDCIQFYKETRNGLLHLDDSSKLSPWLNQGCLSARQVHFELLKYEAEKIENESTYWLRFELLWRDYFKFLSRKIGSRLFHLQGISNRQDVLSVDESRQERFLSWCAGRTADPFVNANMNELNETAWMSNRGRQNVASYLIHQLQVPWTWGAQYFEQQLLDYDPDLNWGNWLYLSGRGTDPRARVFNPVLQAQIYDPDQTYQKKWSRSR